MGIGKIMSKAMSYVAHSGKSTVKAAQKAVTSGAKKAAPSILSKVETNTAGRILRMQDAKAALTPYATKVTKESVPTLHKIEEITGVARGRVKDEMGFFDLKRVAQARAAFTAPAPKAIQGGKLGVTSVPTQQYLDDMLGIAKVDALKAYENGGHATRQILENRNAAREAFTINKQITPRWELGFTKPKQGINFDFSKYKYGKSLKPLDLSHENKTLTKILGEFKEIKPKNSFAKIFN